jgi:predicted nucleic acid-binding protein
METKHKNQPIIVADASGIISLVVDTDSNHEAALQLMLRLDASGVQPTIVVPGELLAETVNLLGKKFSRGLAIETAELLLTQAPFLVRETDPETHTSALELFRQAPGSVSYTDCIVLAMADKYATREVFGFENFFKQRGYHLPSSGTAPEESAA